jgi:hypothetical protein
MNYYEVQGVYEIEGWISDQETKERGKRHVPLLTAGRVRIVVYEIIF